MTKHGKCHLCDATCMQCKGPESEDCTSCPESRLFEEGQCVIRCKTGRYAMGDQCQLCHHTCQACTDAGPDKCTNCATDRFGVTRYLFQSQCREVCPEGFFHSTRMRCEPCPEECIICAAADQCLHCSPGHKLRNGHCFPLECSKSETSDVENDDCLLCDNGCEKCKLKDSNDQDQKTVCLKCETGFYQLGTDCHQFCPDGTYNMTEPMVCAPCEDKHCAICDQSQCHWCIDGFYVNNGECVDHCEEGFFVDKMNQECEPCHRNCRTCGGPQYDDCDTCEDGFTLTNGECSEGKQLSGCSEKHFRNNQGECELCHSSCKTCFDAGMDDCRSCHTGNFLTAHQTCISHCPLGMFGNMASGKCEECMTGCVTCKDGKVCQRCRSGLYLQHGDCVLECQRGFPQNDECYPCAPECGSCKESPSHCLSCEKQLFLLMNHSCVPHCPQGFYVNNTECRRCPDQCRECNQDGLCKKCAEYYFLHEDKCVDECPESYFSSDKQHECMHCHADCASCDGPEIDDCTVCKNPKAVRYDGECLSTCPNNTYYDKKTNECRECDKSCLTCSSHGPSNCLSCDSNRQIDATGHCVWYNKCTPDSYMDQELECQSCHVSCDSCFGPGEDHCLSCSETHFLLNHTCVEKCPLGYYAEDKERVCERCHFSCDFCVGHHSVECVTCKPGFFKHGSSCVETCPLSYFGNMTAMVCERCDPSCTKCSGGGNRNCLSCREGYVHMRPWGQCLKHCPAGYYKAKKSPTCQKCHPTCKSCSGSGALACLSCYDNFHFMSGICDNPCFVGFYADSQVSDDKPSCKPCDSSCEGCHGPSKWDCTLCAPSQILSDDGRCLTCCGNQTLHINKPIPWECCDCKSSRAVCVLAFNFVMVPAANLGSTAKLFVTVCVLVILFLGGAIFIFLNAQSKKLAITPKTRSGGYKKLDGSGVEVSQPTTSSFGEYSDKIVACEDDEDEDDDEDIVYMTKDGTVYRKFKYGLLDTDDMELEYDDESYSYR